MNRDPFCGSAHMSLIYTSHKGGNLWLGNVSAAVDLKGLEKFDIHSVLTVASELNIVQFPKDSQISHKIVPAIDAPNYKMRPHFASCSEFILDNIAKGKNVLVHCSSGISRSATIVIAFLMHKLNLSYMRIYALVKMKRHLVDPNYGFKDQLIQYQKKISGLNILKQQLKKPQTFRNINPIQNFLNDQKHKQQSKLKWVLPKKGLGQPQLHQPLTPLKPSRRSSRSNSIVLMTSQVEDIRKRTKSMMSEAETKRASLPKIREYQ